MSVSVVNVLYASESFQLFGVRSLHVVALLLLAFFQALDALRMQSTQLRIGL